MEYDKDKVDEMVLALLHLTMFEEGEYGARAVFSAKCGFGAPRRRLGRVSTLQNNKQPIGALAALKWSPN